MSPTTIFLWPAGTLSTLTCQDGWGGGVPGVWGREGGLEGLYRYPPDPSQDPYSSIFKAEGPTYGQMKVNLRYIMRFPEVS